MRSSLRRILVLVVCATASAAWADGPPVSAVRFAGNSQVATADLEKAVAPLRQKLTDPASWKEIGYAVSDVYFDRGFVQIRIDDAKQSADGALVVHIIEGPQYRLGKLTFVDQWARPTAELEQLLECKPGELFSRSRLTTGIARLKKVAPYPTAETIIDTDKHVIDLTFRPKI